MHHVSDIRSNEHDQLAYAVKKLGRSEVKRKIFRAVYAGKTAIKTVDDISRMTGLKRKAVLDGAKILATAKLIHQVRHNNDTAYTKDSDYKGLWKRALSLDREKLAKLPTKINPRGGNTASIVLKLPRNKAQIKRITIDDVASFARVKKIKGDGKHIKIAERKFKIGILKILKDRSEPDNDWGGEKNDILTNKLYLGSKRYYAAFALKGPGKTINKLTSKHMGKNGDQIHRLYRSSAQIFFVQYWKDIDQGILDLMEQLSIAKAFTEVRCIYFGIIDGDDSARLIRAYPSEFR